MVLKGGEKKVVQIAALQKSKPLEGKNICVFEINILIGN